MGTDTMNKLLTDDESAILGLLQYINAEEEEFQDPENGSYLDRMEALLRNATELDSTLVKIVVDRTHFFMGKWTDSHFNGSCSYEVIPATSPASERLTAALVNVNTLASSGVKGDILEIVDNLQIDYFWRDSENPDPEELHEITEMWTAGRIVDPTLHDFIQWNLLFPWNEFLGIVFQEVPEGHRLFAWNEECKAFNNL
jgi:hypothetical protein